MKEKMEAKLLEHKVTHSQSGHGFTPGFPGDARRQGNSISLRFLSQTISLTAIPSLSPAMG